jgi:hypothetical protein
MRRRLPPAGWDEAGDEEVRYKWPDDGVEFRALEAAVVLDPFELQSTDTIRIRTSMAMGLGAVFIVHLSREPTNGYAECAWLAILPRGSRQIRYSLRILDIEDANPLVAGEDISRVRLRRTRTFPSGERWAP